MTKKILKITGIVLGLLILLYIGWLVYLKIRIDRGDLIKWDNKFYTKEELAQKFPPQEYNVPAKNTPEQVYTAFRQALLKNDIEGALAQIREENRAEYAKKFVDKLILDKYKKIPDVEEIKKSEKESIGNYANYYYFIDGMNKDDIPLQIEFIKSSEGIWQINFI